MENTPPCFPSDIGEPTGRMEAPRDNTTSGSETLRAPNSTATALPPAAPKPAEGLRIVELDNQYRPVYAHGLEYAAIGLDGQLYIINVRTGEMDRATDDEHPKYHAAFSADYVAWIDHRRKIELPGVDSNPTFNYSGDIFVLDRATGEEKRITGDPARRMSLESSGDWLVWMDRRNESGQKSDHFDIYAYNLRTGEEIPVAVAPGSQRSPAIHGTMVVWADNRNSPAMGTSKAGCGNCPENRFEIHALDLSTGEERVLVENGCWWRTAISTGHPTSTGPTWRGRPMNRDARRRSGCWTWIAAMSAGWSKFGISSQARH